MHVQRGSAKTILIIFLLIGFWVWFFTKAPLKKYQRSLMHMYVGLTSYIQDFDLDAGVSELSEEVTSDELKLGQTEVSCDGKLPQQGKLYLSTTDEANLKQKSRLFVNNGHIFPVWVTLLDADKLDPVSSFYVNPGKHAKFNLPVGEYFIEVQSGDVWCNLTQGFETPAFLDPDNLITINPNEVSHISISSYGSAPSDMMFSVSQGGHLPGAVQGNGTLALQKVLGGYAAQVTINQKPATFIVDTGASITAVPYDFGVFAGIKGCEKRTVVTASGITKVCEGVADEVTVGQFVLKNVKVAYGKDMPKDTFLLGMNVLGQFKMVQEKGGMVLSRK